MHLASNCDGKIFLLFFIHIDFLTMVVFTHVLTLYEFHTGCELDIHPLKQKMSPMKRWTYWQWLTMFNNRYPSTIDTHQISYSQISRKISIAWQFSYNVYDGFGFHFVGRIHNELRIPCQYWSIKKHLKYM